MAASPLISSPSSWTFPQHILAPCIHHPQHTKSRYFREEALGVASSQHGNRPTHGGLLRGNVTGFDSNPFVTADDGLQSWTKDCIEPVQMDEAHPPTIVLAPGRRIVAIGDLHGDIDQTRHALRLAGLLSSDGQDRWLGGNAVLVQVGDVLDRGENEIAILSLLRWLKFQAGLKGGAVFQVNGNHETMNVAGEFRYVDPGGYFEAERFVAYCDEEHGGNWEAALLNWRTSSRKRKLCQTLPFDSWMPWNFLKMQKAVAARSFLFSPGGPLARELSRHGVVLKVNDWLFAHGGILPHHVVYGLERMNKEVSQWMMGNRNHLTPFIATKGFDSVVWSRLYSRETFVEPERVQACAVLKAMLKAAGAKGLVVGHTPQTLGANSECDGQIWRIDVGMSSGVLHAQPVVLEIVGTEVKVVNAPKNSRALDDGHIKDLTKDMGHFTTI